jgi:hypothetical protein
MTEFLFSHSVKIDGSEVRDIVLAGASINYGTRSPGEQLVPANAYLTLISYDAAGDLVVDFPEFTFGSGVPSGFVTEYKAKYEGGETRLDVGATVEIGTTTPSGFTTHYESTYLGGYEDTRFTGIITSIDYTPAAIAITAVTRTEALTRVKIEPTSWPIESETARANRIATAAGIPITIEGSSTVDVIATTDKEASRSAYQMFADLASDCDALVFARRTGEITYRTRTASTGHTTVDLEPGATLVDDLSMTVELGDVVNKITATYGAKNPDGQRPTHTMTDDASIAKYGERETTVDLQLQDLDDVIAHCSRVLDHNALPVWHMPTATVNMNLNRNEGTFPANIEAILGLDLDDDVRLPKLLPGSPVSSYTSRILGYAEVLDPYQWTITYSLNPAGWTKKI